MPEPQQLTLESLKAEFKVPGKTLKLKVRESTSLQDAIFRAHGYVLNNQEGYNRIEFKFGICYFVVAKLKEGQDA